MKKILSLLLIGFFGVLFVSTHSAHATGPITTSQILSPTVKIFSLRLTANNNVSSQSLASGTLISADGKVMTNDHVVKNEYDEIQEAFQICVVLNLQEKPQCLFTASLISTSKSLDIAVLQINPQDIYGNPIPTFPFLKADTDYLPAEGDKLKVWGYPGIGGDTITLTEGTVGGYDEREGIKQMKTDANISPGNSGGTVIDSQGNFIGVPSYLRSNYTSLGFVVPMAEILPWLTLHIDNAPDVNEFARLLTNESAQVEVETDKSLRYHSTLFPQYRIDIPKPWKTIFINRNNFVALNTVEGQDLYIVITVNNMPFEVDQKVMDFLLGKMEKDQHEYTNYKREKASFKGLDGFLIQYDEGQVRHYQFIAPKENTTVTYRYRVILENRDVMEQAALDFLETFELMDGVNNTLPMLREYSQSHPNISLKAFDDFLINPVFDSQYEEEIVRLENPKSFEQNFRIFEKHLSKDYWDLSIPEILEEETKEIGTRLVNSFDDVVIDGLEGYAYTYTYQGDDFNQLRKRTVVVLLTANHRYLEVQYDDLVKNYEQNIETTLKVLKSIQYDGQDPPRRTEQKGVYRVPHFKPLFEDIENHLYEREINALASKNLLSPETDLFLPEEKITRLEALKAIVDAKIFVEKGRNLNTTQDAIDVSPVYSTFTDLPDGGANQMLQFAVEKGIVGSGKLFHPEGAVHLTDALRMLCETFELPMWKPPYEIEIPWFVPYIYKGIELDVIPVNVKFYDQLTRGQFAHLLYKFVKIVGEREDL